MATAACPQCRGSWGAWREGFAPTKEVRPTAGGVCVAAYGERGIGHKKLAFLYEVRSRSTIGATPLKLAKHKGSQMRHT